MPMETKRGLVPFQSLDMLRRQFALVSVAVAFFLLLLLALPADAACPKPVVKVCSEFFKSDAVFVGRVLSQRTVPPRGDLYDGWVYRLRVSRVLRGSLGKITEVFTEDSSGRLPLEVGSEYLLFATLHQGRFEITNCGNSALLAEAMAKIREIEQIAKTSSGVIEGHVASRPTWHGVPGIRLLVRGSQGTYSVISDQEGWFRLAVPPGTYSVQADSGSVIPFDLSNDNPAGFVIPKGGCAQVQFVVETK